MTSNINTTPIDTTFPIAGQDNDTQGFRTNFTAIVNALNTASSEITALQVAQAGITFPNTVTVVTLTATTIVSTGTVTAGYFIGDGSQLVNLPIPTTIASTGTISAQYFVGNGSQLTNVASAASIVSTGTITAAAITAASITSTGTITAGHFVGDGSQLTNVVSSNYARYMPETSKGAPGDTAGQVWSDGTSSIYLCYQNFTGNNADIWAKVAITTPAPWSNV